MTVRILVGDVFDRLSEIDDDSIDCVVTSPPYWCLRDYGVDGQIGLEPTLNEHIDVIVRVFEIVRRALKPTGTVWLNLGDSYATSASKSGGPRGVNKGNAHPPEERAVATGEIKPKDLCMMPNRIAIALQESGWWVRSEIIWAKRNPMPESIRDRPATAHEKIFMLTKSARYFYDAGAVRIEAKQTSIDRLNYGRNTSYEPPGQRRAHTGILAPHKPDKQRGHGRRHAGFNDRWDKMSRDEQTANGRNLRNWEPEPAELEVWDIATKPFSEAHFATFPPDLAARCIKAGCPEKGLVLDPFGGSGTVGLVADRLNRDSVLIELNPEYAKMAERRIQEDAGLFAEVDTNAETFP